MLHIYGNKDHTIKISGEFWDFDRLYYAITKITGAYGIHDELHPYPEIGKVCETLLALNYELRSAQRGDREITAQSNGISSSMFAPAGKEENVIPEGWTSERHFGDSDFDLNAFESEIWYHMPDEIDMDVYEELSNQGKGALLLNLGLDPDEIEEYVNWLEEDDKYIYKFAAKDFPGCGLINTWVAVSIPFSEAFLYALIMQLLLGKKERLISYYKRLEEEEEGMAGIYREYYCCRVHEDFARILHFKESVFTCLYSLIDRETFPAIRAFFEEKAEKITDSSIMEICGCVEKFSVLPGSDTDSSGICAFLEELKSILEKQG